MITSGPHQALALQIIANERARQDAKWGAGNVVNRDRPTALVVLVEEVGEVAKAILEGDDPGYSVELVHVAAVAVAALEAEMRRGKLVSGVPARGKRSREREAPGTPITPGDIPGPQFPPAPQGLPKYSPEGT